jgi:hypothetical protein
MDLQIKIRIADAVVGASGRLDKSSAVELIEERGYN